MTEARVLLDSITGGGSRLTTFEVKLHRFVLAQLNTHRALSRNTSSSRAIPVKKIIQRVEDDPAWPVYWGKNQPGMQAELELQGDGLQRAKICWDEARLDALKTARRLESIGVHKEVINRILEPFSWVTVIVSATDLDNFYALRIDRHAQAEIREAAKLMLQAQKASKPRFLMPGEWHLPLLKPWELERMRTEEARKVSAGRCCRVSYLNHDKSLPDPVRDAELHDQLVQDGHMSPLEHQATPAPHPDQNDQHGNFNEQWIQYRKLIPDENIARYEPLYELA